MIYFFVWIVAGALFFLNLIVGTVLPTSNPHPHPHPHPNPNPNPNPKPDQVVSTFMELLDEDSGITGPTERPLTVEQRRWVYTQQVRVRVLRQG